MAAILTSGATLTCPHGATVTVTANGRTPVADAVVLRTGDTFSITSCTFVLGNVAHPCTSVRWVQAATALTAGGDQCLTEASVGLCLAADQAPQGTVQVSGAQTAANGR